MELIYEECTEVTEEMFNQLKTRKNNMNKEQAQIGFIRQYGFSKPRCEVAGIQGTLLRVYETNVAIAFDGNTRTERYVPYKDVVLLLRGVAFLSQEEINTYTLISEQVDRTNPSDNITDILDNYSHFAQYLVSINVSMNYMGFDPVPEGWCKILEPQNETT